MDPAGVATAGPAHRSETAAPAALAAPQASPALQGASVRAGWPLGHRSASCVAPRSASHLHGDGDIDGGNWKILFGKDLEMDAAE